MTWTVTERATGTGAAGSGNVVSSSFTPASNSVLVCAVQRSNDGSVSSISGHGTWSQVGSTITDVLGAGSNRDLEVWACRVGGSPSASAVTISRGYTNRFDYQMLDLSETAGINGTTVADAFGTPASNGAYTGSPTTLSDTLSAFAQSTNLTLVFGLNEFPHNGAYWSPSAGYTELSEWVSGSSNSNCATAYIASEDTTPSIDWDFSYGNVGMWAVEVKHAASSSIGDLVQSTQNSGGTATLTLGEAPTSGNLLIYGTVSGNSGVTLSTPPSGFTEITSHTSADYSSWWGYKISDGTETARSHVWSAGNGYSLYAEYYWQEGTPRVNSNEDTSNVTADGTGPQSSGSATPHDLTTNLCLAFITSRFQPNSDGSGAFSNSYTADISFAATPTIAGTAIASLANASGSTSSSYSWSDAGIDTYGAIAAFSPPGASGGLLPLLNAYYS